ncbi:MAG: helix-turn-helix domain-containing protein [Chloroflexi bacterium]|nr:helix-turn-helix domain-containing protein [Chloroflexota bacterium]
MESARLGSALRAVRLLRSWRQADVALAAGVSRATVSRCERGHLESLPLATLVRVAASLDVRLDLVPRWRGADLDRTLNAGHAAMHEALARRFAGGPWLTAAEVSFSIYGERGIVDLLAYRPDCGALLVIELKTVLADVQGLIGTVDRYRRLASVMARERGWGPLETVSSWVVLRDTPTNHRRLAAHATVLRHAFPADGRAMRGWLARPSGAVRALSFLSDDPPRNASAGRAGVQRVRRPRLSVDAGPQVDQLLRR